MPSFDPSRFNKFLERMGKLSLTKPSKALEQINRKLEEHPTDPFLSNAYWQLYFHDESLDSPQLKMAYDGFTSALGLLHEHEIEDILFESRVHLNRAIVSFRMPKRVGTALAKSDLKWIEEQESYLLSLLADTDELLGETFGQLMRVAEREKNFSDLSLYLRKSTRYFKSSGNEERLAQCEMVRAHYFAENDAHTIAGEFEEGIKTGAISLS